MTLTDPARVERLLDALIARGLVEESATGDVRGTRAWNAALQRAAEVLNRQAAETGFNPPGHPIRLAVERALTMRGERFPEEDRDDVIVLLVQLELANMTPGERSRYSAYDVA